MTEEQKQNYIDFFEILKEAMEQYNIKEIKFVAEGNVKTECLIKQKNAEAIKIPTVSNEAYIFKANIYSMIKILKFEKKTTTLKEKQTMKKCMMCGTTKNINETYGRTLVDILPVAFKDVYYCKDCIKKQKEKEEKIRKWAKENKVWEKDEKLQTRLDFELGKPLHHKNWENR